jgi:hypothetical protein
VLFCFFWRFIGVALVGGEELPGHCYLCMGLTEAPAVQEQTDPSNYRSSSRTRTDWSLKLHAQTHH